MRSDIFGMSHFYFENVLMELLGGVSWTLKKITSWRLVTRHLIEGIMEEAEISLRFSNVDFIGLP